MHAGKSSFSDDFLWTVLPDDYYDVLEGWGLEKKGVDPKKCHVFLRTFFGSLIYFHENDFYFLSPFIARNVYCEQTFKKLLIRSIL